MKLRVPALSLVVLVGPSGSGKTTLAQKHFKPTEIISFESCLAMVADDDESPEAARDAFETMRHIAKTRLASKRMAVVDATNLEPEERAKLVETAREHHAIPVAIVLNLPGSICQARTEQRAGKAVAMRVVHVQTAKLHKVIGTFPAEGFELVAILRSPNDVDGFSIEREAMTSDRRVEHGPFDVIGDVHGCYEELRTLLAKLGYKMTGDVNTPKASHPDGRKAVFLGDFVDRGPDTAKVARLVMGMVQAGTGFAVSGNHELRLVKALRGSSVRSSHGLAESMTSLGELTDADKTALATFLEALPDHLVFDDGNVVVAHGGLPDAMHGRGGVAVRTFAVEGERPGFEDAMIKAELPAWARAHASPATVVYGGHASPAVLHENHTYAIDTGCVFGGKLTALKLPEGELVDVPAKKAYYETARVSIEASSASDSAAVARADLLDIEDIAGKRSIKTRVLGSVSIQEENALAALEAMSRFAVDPHWLVYLPPTVGPSDTCRDGGELEHPREAFAYFRDEGVSTVVCTEKHAGTRAVIIVCKDENVAVARFGVPWGKIGCIYTRTGRRYFDDAAVEDQVLSRVRAAAERANLFTELATDWLCLECDIASTTYRANIPLHEHFVGTGTAGRAAVSAALSALRLAAERSDGCERLLYRFAQQKQCVEDYMTALRHAPRASASTTSSGRLSAVPTGLALPRASLAPPALPAMGKPASSAGTPRPSMTPSQTALPRVGTTPSAHRPSNIPGAIALPQSNKAPSTPGTARPSAIPPPLPAPGNKPPSTPGTPRPNIAVNPVAPRMSAAPSSSGMLRASMAPPGARAPALPPIGDVVIAPIHLLASEGHVHVDRDHTWHVTTLATLADADPSLLRKTRFRRVDLSDKEGEKETIEFWEELTAQGSEGIVMTPLEWLTRGKRSLVQPSLKVRGREFMRTIYGAAYTLEDNLERLRERPVVNKRSLALREFALSIEALQRFVAKEPLRDVHECVFGILALESELVDPRL